MSAVTRALNLISATDDHPLPPPVEPIDFAPPDVRNPQLPPYVQHADGVSEVGMLSAQALVIEYETAARDIEATGAALTKKCEAITTDVRAMVAELMTVAARYRDEAKRLFDEIESCSKLTGDVRELCTTLTTKIQKRAEDN